MFYACALFAPVGLDWGVMYGYVTSWSGDPFAGKLRPSQHLSKAMHLDGEKARVRRAQIVVSATRITMRGETFSKAVVWFIASLGMSRIFPNFG